MGRLRSRLAPLSGPAVGFLLLIPVALFVLSSIFKYAVGVPLLYEGLGFLADPRRLWWYHRVSPVLFLLGPLAAACLNIAALVKLEARREQDRVVTTITFTPRAANVAVALISVVLLAVLAGYLVAETSALPSNRSSPRPPQRRWHCESFGWVRRAVPMKAPGSERRVALLAVTEPKWRDLRPAG